MTPLEQLLHNRTTTFRLRHAWELEVWAKKTNEMLHEMANVRHRGIASLYNHAVLRLSGRRSARALRAITGKGLSK